MVHTLIRLLKSRSLGVVGTAILMVGLMLAVMKKPDTYPGLIMVLGATFLIAFLLMTEQGWSRRDPAPSHQDAEA